MLYFKLLPNGHAKLATSLVILNLSVDMPTEFADYHQENNRIACFSQNEQEAVTSLADDLEITYTIKNLTWNESLHTLVDGDGESAGATFKNEAELISQLIHIEASTDESESKSEVTYMIVAPPFITTIYVVVHAALTEGWLSNTALDIPMTNGVGTKVFSFGVPNTYRLEFTCPEFGSSNEKKLIVVPESNPVPPLPEESSVLQAIQAENEQLKQRLQATESAILKILDLS